jgi:hypothetical protein
MRGGVTGSLLGLAAACALAQAGAAGELPPAPAPIAVDGEWQALAPVADLAGVPDALERAASALGEWRIELAGVPLDAGALRRAARRARGEPVVRALREELRGAVDPIDLLRFLDDVLVAGERGRRSEAFCITPGRARSAGITIHPDEVFAGGERAYPAGLRELNVDRPRLPGELPAAQDGEALGPRWSSRFPNTQGETEQLAELRALRPDYAARIASLIAQLRRAGADVELTSTVRPRERGYLMWGAFVLSRVSSRKQLDAALASVARRNREWGLDVPIRWRHPGGWQATRAAAREMAESYDVVFATEEGARSSRHYTGVAADLVATALPRRLRLVAPDGRERSFDLSDAEQTRDLSLTPALIEWVEQHFALRKLRSDYPHWEDASAP